VLGGALLAAFTQLSPEYQAALESMHASWPPGCIWPRNPHACLQLLQRGLQPITTLYDRRQRVGLGWWRVAALWLWIPPSESESGTVRLTRTLLLLHDPHPTGMNLTDILVAVDAVLEAAGCGSLPARDRIPAVSYHEHIANASHELLAHGDGMTLDTLWNCLAPVDDPSWAAKCWSSGPAGEGSGTAGGDGAPTAGASVVTLA
jgi:hypothetical protein